MRVVTWNVNSLKARAEHVARYLEEKSPDVLCLQELKLTDEAVPREIFTDRGYHVESHGQKQWNGVLIASKTPLEGVQRGLPDADEGQSRLIAATTGGLRIVNLYVPQGQDTESPKYQYKLRFLAALERWLHENASPSDPLVVLGDINIAPGPDDVWSVEEWEGKPTFTAEEHAALERILDFGLEDVTRSFFEPGTFTFWDYRQMSFRRRRGIRIDLHLTTGCVTQRVVEAWVDRDERKKERPSDHAPVGILLSQ